MRAPVPFIAVIPARYASTRLPAKALADIGGKPMVVRVAEQARKSGAGAVYIATDHRAVYEAAQAHRVNVLMTRADHASGTDRIAEVAARLKLAPSAIVVNVQGDEPLIEPKLIRAVAEKLAGDKTAAMATACHAIGSAAEFLNPNAVKVVLDAGGGALYFSRSPVPYPRDSLRGQRSASWDLKAKGARLPKGLPCYRHIGIYAYRASFLKRYAALKPSPLEQFEALEQLRALWHGYRIAVAVRKDSPEAGVDTVHDLRRVQRIFRSKIDRPRKAR